MSAVAANRHRATATSSTFRQLPQYITPPVLSEPHPWYGTAHQQESRPAHANHGTQCHASDMHTIDGHSNATLTIFDAAMTGNLAVLKELLKTHNADSIQPSTGLSPLHYASSRGHIQLVNYLLGKAGATVDLEDREGETALLKAAYNGHDDIVAILIEKYYADVSHQDKDGWSALHNACSCNHAGIASLLLDHHADIDILSKMGHTPLINASAKGNVPMVTFLLENDANPLMKNKFEETAYDAAAASAYPYICELLEHAEIDWWSGRRRNTNGAIVDVSHITRNTEYDPLLFHVTIPIVLHENQRAMSTFIGLTKPEFSSSTLLRQEEPWTTYPDNEPTRKQLVQLPPLEYSSDSNTQSTWFWMSDWQIEYSHPLVDGATGWQYSKAFDTPDHEWSPRQPMSGTNWVRRRRWFRLMKKRVDIDGGMPTEAITVNYLARAESIFGAINDDDDPEEFDREWRMRIYSQGIRTLIDGIKVVKRGVSSTDDRNNERRMTALRLMKTYIDSAEALGYTFDDITDRQYHQEDGPAPTLSRESSYRRQFTSTTTASPLTIAANIMHGVSSAAPSDSPDAGLQEARNNLLESLGRARSGSPRNGHMSPTSQSVLIERQPVLRRGSSFHSQASSTLSRSANVWERDENAMDCRRCGSYFSILLRRHHCRQYRMCGLVVCDRCSMNRVLLPPQQIVYDPATPIEQKATIASSPQRLCDTCTLELHIPRSPPSIGSISIPPRLRRSMSAQSVMRECPVCYRQLSSIGNSKDDQELHVQACLNGENPAVQGVKYVLYTLQENSALIGRECTICFEDFVAGKLTYILEVARVKFSLSIQFEPMQETLWQDSIAFVHTIATVYTIGSAEEKDVPFILQTELLM